jgi:hypothetical protein
MQNNTMYNVNEHSHDIPRMEVVRVIIMRTTIIYVAVGSWTNHSTGICLPRPRRRLRTFHLQSTYHTRPPIRISNVNISFSIPIHRTEDLHACTLPLSFFYQSKFRTEEVSQCSIRLSFNKYFQ